MQMSTYTHDTHVKVPTENEIVDTEQEKWYFRGRN